MRVIRGSTDFFLSLFADIVELEVKDLEVEGRTFWEVRDRLRKDCSRGETICRMELWEGAIVKRVRRLCGRWGTD
jgi:hypothetical protein